MKTLVPRCGMTSPKTFRTQRDILLVLVVAGWKPALQITRFETIMDRELKRSPA